MALTSLDLQDCFVGRVASSATRALLPQVTGLRSLSLTLTRALNRRWGRESHEDGLKERASFGSKRTVSRVCFLLLTADLWQPKDFEENSCREM